MEKKKRKKENVNVKAKSDGRIFCVDRGNLELKDFNEVIFESDQCQEAGVIIPDNLAESGLNKEDEEGIAIIRKTTDKDKEKLNERKKEARETISQCQEKVKKHKLTMNLLDANISFDGKKLTFYFCAPTRIDFRSLIPDLASTFKKLIRLQQVGARDKAKYSGGVGRCGRTICCRSFLRDELESVTTEMAYDQNLGQMGSNRVTGACGKLMCCLKYELSYYREKKSKMPAIGSEIKTSEGQGVVLSHNVIKNKIVVELKKDKRIVEENC